MCSSCWAEKKEALSLKGKVALLCHSGKPLPAVAPVCCCALGVTEASFFYNVIWTFWNGANVSHSFHLIFCYLVICTSSCHNTCIFCCWRWNCRGILPSIPMTQWFSAYKRVQNNFYQTFFFPIVSWWQMLLLICTDTTLWGGRSTFPSICVTLINHSMSHFLTDVLLDWGLPFYFVTVSLFQC